MFLHRLGWFYYRIRRTCECRNNDFVRYSNAATLHIDIYTQTHYIYINTLRLCVHLGVYIFCIWSDGGWRDKIRSEKTTILYVAVKENKNIYK